MASTTDQDQIQHDDLEHTDPMYQTT